TEGDDSNDAHPAQILSELPGGTLMNDRNGHFLIVDFPDTGCQMANGFRVKPAVARCRERANEKPTDGLKLEGLALAGGHEKTLPFLRQGQLSPRSISALASKSPRIKCTKTKLSQSI